MATPVNVTRFRMPSHDAPEAVPTPATAREEVRPCFVGIGVLRADLFAKP